MSAASAQTFNYMTKQQQQQQQAAVAAGGYRYAIEDRYRWAQVNEANFYSVSRLPSPYVDTQQLISHHDLFALFFLFFLTHTQQPEHLLTSSQQHVYATPSRVATPNALIAEEVFEPRLNHYSRPTRSKSRNSTLHGHHYQTNVSSRSNYFPK